jgi:hypothetical protein
MLTFTFKGCNTCWSLEIRVAVWSRQGNTHSFTRSVARYACRVEVTPLHALAMQRKSSMGHINATCRPEKVVKPIGRSPCRFKRPELFGISYRGGRVPTEPIGECSGRCDRYSRAKYDTRYSVKSVLWVGGAHAVHSRGKREDKLSVASVRVTLQIPSEAYGCKCAQGKMRLRSTAHSAWTSSVATSFNSLITSRQPRRLECREKTVSGNRIANYASGIMSMLSFRENSAFQSRGGR